MKKDSDNAEAWYIGYKSKHRKGETIIANSKKSVAKSTFRILYGENVKILYMEPYSRNEDGSHIFRFVEAVEDYIEANQKLMSIDK